ncbi:MAG: 50S ribosomal protein L22 [Candidatus Dadabacteria bacterium]|nr:50S ribosomal protein L22 [Candidatus Dadabacteria bacterium]
MVSQAVHKYVKTSSRKARLVLDLIRGMGVEQAFAILSSLRKRNAPVVAKLLKSAVANAYEKGYSEPEDLVVTEASASPGPSSKRFRPRAMGRAFRIIKRTAHITIVLDEKEV